MFRGEILGKMYYTWSGYKAAWNKAVLEGKLLDKKAGKSQSCCDLKLEDCTK